MLNRYWYRGRIRTEYRKSRRRNEALAERRSAIACSQIPWSPENYSTRRIQTSYRIHIHTIYAMGNLRPRNAIRNFDTFFKISVFIAYMYCICSMISYGTRFSVHCRDSWKMLLGKFRFSWGSMGAGDDPHIFTILHRMTLYVIYMRSALAILWEKADFWKSWNLISHLRSIF